MDYFGYADCPCILAYSHSNFFLVLVHIGTKNSYSHKHVINAIEIHITYIIL